METENRCAFMKEKGVRKIHMKRLYAVVKVLLLNIIYSSRQTNKSRLWITPNI